MALKGHVLKEISRKIRTCVIEDGLSPDQCVNQIEEEYELTPADRDEIKGMAKAIGK